jgi:PKHD-type hydroxylase
MAKSLNLFLNAPSEYEGGELVLEEVGGERSFKLEARSLILYPSHTLHRVETVTDGVRKVAVAWVQSLIRDPLKREILFDLDTVRRSLFHKEGKTTEFDLLSKCHANLLRQFVEN